MKAGLIQFFLGFVIGVVLLAGGAAGAVYLFVNRLADAPPKPEYPEESVAEEPSEATTAEQTALTSADDSAGASAEELPSGAYRARVTWGQGLSLRAEPSIDAERIGGVGYNSEITILNSSEDQNWQYVRLPGSAQEGWIKAGNVEKIEEQ